MYGHFSSHPPSRQDNCDALLEFASLPVAYFDQKYLHFRNVNQPGDLVQYRHVNSFRNKGTVIVEFKANEQRRVFALVPSSNSYFLANWLYFLADESLGGQAQTVQLAVLARRAVTCEHYSSNSACICRRVVSIPMNKAMTDN